MISPRKWTFRRPGQLIPVFFLSIIPVVGQSSLQEASVASCGGSFVTRQGYGHAMYNQAGLGRITGSSFSIQHIRPFILSELGISMLSVQVPAGSGSIGAIVSSYGLQGFRRSSLWMAYGMKLYPGITAGAGIHLWSMSVPGKLFFHPGISCALGFQARISSQLILGCHVLHPVSWAEDGIGNRPSIMVLSTGCSYTFFQTATFHTDLHISPEGNLQLSCGIELAIRERIQLFTGIHNRPPGISGGLALLFSHWKIHVAFDYLTDTGSTPSSSLTYAW